MTNQQKLDELVDRVRRIERTLQPGIAGKRGDGEFTGFVRRDMVRPVRRVVEVSETILSLIRPGEEGKYNDGRLARALRELLKAQGKDL